MAPELTRRSLYAAAVVALAAGLVAFLSQRLIGESAGVAMIGAVGSGLAVALLLIVWQVRSVSRP
jgi:uncharacterized MnhB-related membrane protein